MTRERCSSKDQTYPE